MTLEDFLRRCPTLWHVGPPGSWDRVCRHGLRTAQQLIDAADIDAETRRRLTDEPRRHSVELRIGDEAVVLRDQGPLLARKDITPLLAPGMTVADWVRLLNRRVYLFAERPGRDTLTKKYAARHGSQEVITVDPMRLLALAGERVELTDQNTGAIARVGHPYKLWDTFKPVDEFPNRRPKEITVIGGVTPAEIPQVVSRVDRVGADGAVEALYGG